MGEGAVTLLPNPKRITYQQSVFIIYPDDRINISYDDKNQLFFIVKKLKQEVEELIGYDLEIAIGDRGNFRQAVSFQRNSDLAEQGYRLEVGSEHIRIEYNTPVGAFYGTRTLKQLIQQFGRRIPGLEIADEPDYLARGLMIDIGRNKIPKQETLYRIVDLMADMKLNQLQLYIEGYPFAYPSYSQVWQAGTPLTGEEIMKLDQYCQENYIELVPNQNSFGHMAPWLTLDQFNHLAECPEGFELWGGTQPPGTLNPQNLESIHLVENLYDDILPYFSSDLFNVGCDETFELGRGKSKELCAKKGTGRVYLDFILQVYQMVKERGKRMMFWGDILNQHPELIPELPQDVIALEWGYEGNHPFDEHGKTYQKSEIPFYVCPGTSCWNSLAGRTENMKQNLVNAAIHGKKYGAIGFLNTDWGDHGHWQYLPVSYPAFAYGAALSWCVEENQDVDLAAYLNDFIFKDQMNLIGDLLLNLGNFYLKEGKLIFNGTNVARFLYAPLEKMTAMEGISIENLQKVREHVEEIEMQLPQVEMTCDDAMLIMEELKNTIRFIEHSIDLGILKVRLSQGESLEGEKVLVQRMRDDLSLLIHQHKKLWLERNRLGDLDQSVAKLERLKREYSDLLTNI